MRQVCFLIMLALVGCGGGGNDEQLQSPGNNRDSQVGSDNSSYPVVSITSNSADVTSGQTLRNLVASASDADGFIASFEWRASTDCDGGTWNGASSSTPTYIVPEVTETTPCTLVVTVVDDDGLSNQASLDFEIYPATVSGILARSWSGGSSAIDPNNSLLAPYADISDAGEIIGAWLVDYAGQKGIEGGSLNADSLAWDLSGRITPVGEDVIDSRQWARLTVEAASNGFAIAAWSSRNVDDLSYSIWASLSYGDGVWLAPKKVVSDSRARDIKAAVNGQGNSSIAWIDSNQDVNLIVLDSLAKPISPIHKIGRYTVSRKFQSSRIHYYTNGFHLDINEANEVVAVAVSDGTYTDHSGIYLHKFTQTAGMLAPIILSEEGQDHLTKDMDMEVSPSGNIFVAWQQYGNYGNQDLKGRMFQPSVGWGEIESLESRNDADFLHPKVDINDNGEVILAVGYEGPGDGGLSDIYLTRKDTAGVWSNFIKIHTYGHSWVDVGIDESGHSLILFEDIGFVSAGTFSKQGVWNGYDYIGSSGGYGHMFNQRLRMTPDGQALITWTGRNASGFRVLR